MIHDIDKSSLTMVDWECCNCGVISWMPKALNDNLKNSHKSFYCLNGHGQSYSSPTDVEEIKNQLVSEQAKNAQLEGIIKGLRYEVADLKSIKETLKLISDKANKSFFKKFFD